MLSSVAVFAYDGVSTFGLGVTAEVFGCNRKGEGIPRFDYCLAAAEPGMIRTDVGLPILVEYGLDRLRSADLAVIACWDDTDRQPPEPVLAALRSVVDRGGRVLSACTGAFVLAAAGLLDGRRCTTHWLHAPTLARRYPRTQVLPRELVVEDGEIITGAGAAAGLDACLYVVRRDHGAQAAARLARRLVFPAGRRGGQTPYFDNDVPDELRGDPLADAMSWALDHLTEPLDVDAMAARAAMSRRSFDRKFRGTVGVAPLQWLNAQRVMYAQRMLESTDLAMDQIAIRSGFGSLVAMRGHFRRMLSTSPTAYRSSFRTLPADRRAPGRLWPDGADDEDPKDVSENIDPAEGEDKEPPEVDG